MKTIERSVQQHRPLIDAIIKQHLKGSTCRHQELMALLMGMCATALTTRYIVTIEHPLHLERKMNVIVNICKIALRKRVFGQLYERAIIDCWFLFVSHCVIGFNMYLSTTILTTIVIASVKTM